MHAQLCRTVVAHTLNLFPHRTGNLQRFRDRSLPSNWRFCATNAYCLAAFTPTSPYSNKSSVGTSIHVRKMSLYESNEGVGAGSMLPTKLTEINRAEFAFEDYDIVGFDLDCTLLRYNLNEMVPLVYELLRQFLVNERHYPSELMERDFNADFLQKGLILDCSRGNILKLNGAGHITKGTHGTTALTHDELCEIYGPERKWVVSTQFVADPISTWNGPLSRDIRTLLDYFDMAVSLVFGQLVDVMDARNGGPPPRTFMNYTFFPDLVDALVHLYVRDNFANGRSAFFNSLRAQPERYILKTNDDTVMWLKKMRAAGKAVYLLTGSNTDFANLTASYALGANWMELFDLVICYGKKPAFFIEDRPFLRVEGLSEVPGSEIALEDNLPLNNVYTQGNWTQAQRCLAAKLGKPPADVRSIYVGDNLIQDCFAPRRYAGVDSLVLCEELLDELEQSAYEFHEIVSSKFWGSYFHMKCDNVPMPTLWSAVIGNSAQLCVPTLDVVVRLPLNHRITNKHEESYYPVAPPGFVPCTHWSSN